jgi:hypothetical protein
MGACHYLTHYPNVRTVKQEFLRLIMTPALISTLFGVVGYAIVNVIIGHKLIGVSALSSIPAYTGVLALSAMGTGMAWTMTGHTLHPWTSAHLPWLLAIGLVLLFADICYVGAFNLPGSSVSMITTTASLMPVMVAIIERCFITGAWPSARTLIAFGLAVVVVWLVAYDPANTPKTH